MNNRRTATARFGKCARGLKVLPVPRWTWWLLALAAAAPLAVPGRALAQGRTVAAPTPNAVAAGPAARERAAPLRAAEPAASAAPAAPTERADRADLDRTQILGNRELPKVLYIVPWKKPLHGNMGGRAVAGVVDEALAPIDRDVLRRQVSYDAQIRAAVTGTTPAGATPAKTP